MKKIIILPLLAAITSTSCTLNEGDPQITLCQKLSEYITQNKGLQWSEAKKSPESDQSMKVEIRTSDNSPAKVQGVCIYLSDADDAGKDYDVNILPSYQNLPSSISINGKHIATKELHLAIQEVTGQSIKDTLRKFNK